MKSLTTATAAVTANAIVAATALFMDVDGDLLWCIVCICVVGFLVCHFNIKTVCVALALLTPPYDLQSELN